MTRKSKERTSDEKKMPSEKGQRKGSVDQQRTSERDRSAGKKMNR